ncbi:MAG: glycoside hydrolase family 65 protein [Ferruginibacter sp.]|nr:glycoside hydrolase family 65 protein [Ferruginibacter sp.]
MACLLQAVLAQVQTTNKKNLWVVTTTDTSNYTPAYLGNGVIGIRSDRTGLCAQTVHLNGLYDRVPLKDNIHLVNEYNPTFIRVIFKDGQELKFDHNIANWRQTLNLKEGYLETAYNYADKLGIKTQLMPLRNLPLAALSIVEFEAREDITFTILNSVSIPDRSKSSAIHKPAFDYKLYRLSARSNEKIPVMSTNLPTESGTDCVAGANTFYFDGPVPALDYTRIDAFNQQLSFKVVLKKGEKYSFCMLSAFTHTGFTSDPYNDAVRICSRDYNLGYRYLLQEHKNKWAKLWESDIEIEGDDQVQLDIRVGLYALYASVAPGFQLSIPPCGIANEWGGHIFWDAELWMYPPLLVLHPSLALSMIDFRSNTLPQAKKRAAQFGYDGAMYPWESDLQGNECTSINYKLDMTEHHITADIAIAAWNYYQVTQDRVWLQQKGFPLLKEIADFWISRVSKDSTGNYHINNVVGPDEYFEDVNDDAFTNGVVKLALDAGIKTARLLSEPVNPEWQAVYKNIVILKHQDGYTLQNDRYTTQIIKQTDVNLLAFPLELITDKTQVLKDLEFYEPKIFEKGPSMSYSVLATSYARLGQTKKAYELFLKAFQPNRKPPFNFIAERPNNNVTVFCTGYGGILQTIIFGFAGMRIGENGLYQAQTNLPPHWKKLTIKVSGRKDIVCVGK